MQDSDYISHAYIVTQDSNNQVSHGGEQPNAYGAKLQTIRSGNPGHYLVGIHQMAPP